MTKVKVFSGGRSNGKTRRLMEYAAKNGMAVLTTNKNSLEYKASCYGINFVSIKNQNDIKTLEEKFKDNNSYIVEIAMKETPTRLQTQYDEVKEYDN